MDEAVNDTGDTGQAEGFVEIPNATDEELDAFLSGQFDSSEDGVQPDSFAYR